MDNIIWRRIIINNELYNYEVSSTGLVRNYETKKIRKLDITGTGYFRVALYNNEGKRKNIFVHRLVAMAFIPIPEKYSSIGLTFDDLVPDHLDYNPLNNNYTNLEWKTIGDNTRAARDSGHFCMGEKSHLSTITKSQALKIIKMLLNGKSVKYISDKMNITESVILHIKNKESWKNLTKFLEFPKQNNSKPYTVNENKIHEICRLLELGELRQIDIAKKVGVSREYVKDIKHRKRRKDISYQYDF